MKKIAMLVLLALSVNANAQNRRGGDDSTGLSLSFIQAATQQRGVDSGKMQSQRIDIPTREIVYNQPIYITNPPAQPTPMQCTSYETITEFKYRYAKSEESLCWGGCSCIAGNPPKPEGLLVNTGSTAPTSSNKQCLPTYYLVPVYTTKQVCNAWG